MFKIEIRNDNKLVKKKFYESKMSFDRWLNHHKEHYERFYTVTGFKQSKNGEWRKSK
jgi:hypothetical protein